MNETLNITTVAREFAIRPAVVSEVVEKDVAMTVSAMIGTFAAYVQAIIDDKDASSKMCDRENLASLIEPYFSDLIRLRIAQVMRSKLPQPARDIEVPACFYAVLEMIGEYKGTDDGLYLFPSNKDNLELDNTQRSRVSMLLRVAGMPISIGLPRVIAVETDKLFRLSIVNNSIVAACGTEGIDPVNLLVRTFVEFEPLSAIYGQYRYAYQDVRLVGSAYERLAALGLK